MMRYTITKRPYMGPRASKSTSRWWVVDTDTGRTFWISKTKRRAQALADSCNRAAEQRKDEMAGKVSLNVRCTRCGTTHEAKEVQWADIETLIEGFTATDCCKVPQRVMVARSMVTGSLASLDDVEPEKNETLDGDAFKPQG